MHRRLRGGPSSPRLRACVRCRPALGLLSDERPYRLRRDQPGGAGGLPCRAGAHPAGRQARSAPRSSRSIRAAPIVTLARSRSTATTDAGRTSRRATRAAIRFPLSPISPTCPRARRRGCSAECWGSKPEASAMADGLDFSPLSDREREAAAQELARRRRAGRRKAGPAAGRCGSARADAAARLFGRAPDALWRYADAAGALAFCVCRWNKPDGDKDIRPVVLV